jgi:hypothetical protein
MRSSQSEQTLIAEIDQILFLEPGNDITVISAGAIR